ncbi:hypothetical protein [Emticicia sp. C21]|uniref:hypothetical protein n=1 Tax=Emticicia sp. C21 TaxID=2302915 RepID=UPI0011C14647|nr:hypothetical protein [Emticicia sp. C21]
MGNTILYYGNREIARAIDTRRFLISCFTAPDAALNLYFSMLRWDAEEGKMQGILLSDACGMLKIVALQGWTSRFAMIPQITMWCM